MSVKVELHKYIGIEVICCY